MKTNLNREFTSTLGRPQLSWRWPTYQEWLTRSDFCSFENSDSFTFPGPAFWKAVPESVLSKLRAATFIEWRYYSIISQAFHGICGFSLFNPEQHFAEMAEGGLIAIVAGGLDGAAQSLSKSASHSAADQIERAKEFCFMHVFPMDSVIFYGPERQHVRAHHQGIELTIEQVDVQTADIFIEMEGGLSLKIRHQAAAGCPVLAPVTGTDFRTIPGAHWTVFNPSPVAEVNGTLIVHPGLLHMSENAPGVHNPNFISPPLAERLYNGYVKIQLEKAAGYYEHSFGMNPMPLHGWDFVFVPSPQAKAGLVLQTYRGSEQVSYLEVLWADERGEWKVLHVPQSDLEVEWVETSWHPVMRVHVPRKRKIVARHQGYTIEINNSIEGEIPFVRAHSPVVRHFFISEELSVTSWKVTDAQGRVCVAIDNALSGGETARGRWFYNLNGIFSLSAQKPF